MLHTEVYEYTETMFCLQTYRPRIHRIHQIQWTHQCFVTDAWVSTGVCHI